MEPSHTDYRRRIQYQTYNVTELLKKGEKRLVQAMEQYGWWIGTGFLSTPLIADGLTRHPHADILQTAALQLQGKTEDG